METHNIAIEDISLDVCRGVGSRQTDGRGVVTLSIASALRGRGNKVDLLTRPGRKLHSYWASRVKLRYVEGRTLPDFMTDGTPYDFLLVNHRSVANRLGNISVVYQPHEIELLRLERTGVEDKPAIERQKELMRRSDKVLVPSREIFDWLDSHEIVSPERLLLAPHGIDTGIFRQRDRKKARRAVGIGQNVPLALFVGVIEKRKGLHVLMKAFDKLPDHIHLWIVGGLKKGANTSDLELFKSLTKWTGLPRFSGRVKLLGTVPWLELPNYYSAADVVVLPALMEPFGLPTCEAIACGTPVVGSNIDGFRELVPPDEHDLLVKPDDAAALAWALTKSLSDQKWQAAERKSARAAHAASFTWDRVAITLETVAREMRAKARIEAQAV